MVSFYSFIPFMFSKSKYSKPFYLKIPNLRYERCFLVCLCFVLVTIKEDLRHIIVRRKMMASKELKYFFTLLFFLDLGIYGNKSFKILQLRISKMRKLKFQRAVAFPLFSVFFFSCSLFFLFCFVSFPSTVLS